MRHDIGHEVAKFRVSGGKNSGHHKHSNDAAYTLPVGRNTANSLANTCWFEWFSPVIAR
jgi:hypothetical protein